MNPMKALTIRSVPASSAIELHRALGHPSLAYLKRAFPDSDLSNLECSVCDVPKMHRTPFSGSFPVASRTLESSTASSSPSDVISDNGGEFINNRFKQFYAQRGVQHIPSAPYTPQQNPFAERGNRTTIEKARTLLATSGLPLTWWGEAVTTSVYLENRSPNSSIKFSSPYELWHGTPPDLSHLVPFGCRAITYLEKHGRFSKFSPLGVEAIFLGYDEHHHSYKLWVLTLSKIIVTHHVKFSPSCFPALTSSTISPCTDTSLFDFDLTPAPAISSQSVTPTTNLKEIVSEEVIPSPVNEHEPPAPAPPVEPSLADPPITTKGYTYVPNYSVAPKDINSAIDPSNIIEGGRRGRALDPKTYGDILGRLDEEHWLMVVEVELNNITRHEVWVVAPLTPGAKPLDTVWVFKRKFNADGDLLKYKACLCVRGFRQIEGTDYGATFAPTGRPTTLRLVMGHDFEIHQMDVKCAFLNGVPDKDLFIKVPPGVGIELPPGHGLKLQKSLYGLKQSPRCWYQALKTFFTSINFLPATVNPCLFIHQDPSQFCCVFIHVDDLVIIGPDVDFFKAKIKARFEMEDLGECNWHTRLHGLTLGAVGGQLSTLVAYSDASHSSATQAYSFAGSAIIHNGLIGWQCAKMDNDAPSISTTESEYRACSETGQDILWVQQLLDCLRPLLHLSASHVTLYCDNQGALALLEDTVYQHRT
ncbi:hypothetical protein MJO28_003145 [Puccinia striiformis f. sp. tritici]|uniref:Uncharacterized protein n=1 Tax=Puccinia striiformis f. sp. tritici TaxID=168172 RepID=A0ACC0ESH0_9BASI|nr:hypothetical protein MJO28_003145 [Puccinia striiformis f. sp. tritici]